MSVYTRFVTGFLFPLHEKLKGHSTMRVHREMDETQWLGSDQINQLQLDSLREFLCDVQAHVPFYKNLFSQINFDPSELKSLDDLKKLPLLDKETIRSNTESMKASNAEGLQRFNTGGSSGEPLIFYIGNKRVSHDVAAKRRATRWWGVDVGDPEIVVWGSPIELGSQDRVRVLRDRLFRSRLLSAFEMSKDNLDKFVRAIITDKPKMLFGYPSSLAVIAEHASANNFDMSKLGIKVAFVTSERLYDHQREKIENVFGCPVANGYGGRDAGFIAHQCPAGSMHITADDIVVEILDPDGNSVAPGERGEIVVTHLRTNDFPFVRYRTGDVGKLSPEACSCGRGLPVLKEIEGRATDFVLAQDGTLLHGLSLIYTLRDIPEVRSFKIVQKSLDSVHVMLVTASSDKSQLENTVQTAFRKRLGNTVDVSFEYLASIPREKSGKFRYVVSEIT